MKRESRAPFIVALAIVLLLLPILYVGSYMMLVSPEPDLFVFYPGGWYRISGYRIQSRITVVYWPVEQIDRRIRPDVWSRAAEEEFWNVERSGRAPILPASPKASSPNSIQP